MAITETFTGFIETTADALLIFEACRRGKLPRINRRLQEGERGSVRSGTVYVFDEQESGIKRWTDGLIWSPSRILGNFLIYRELESRDFLYRSNRAHNSFMCPEETEENDLYSMKMTSNEERNQERNLVGSLTDTYKFKKDGLIKKTISIHLSGSTQHLISYYTKSDVMDTRLASPSSIPELSCLQLAPDLLVRQSFRIPPSVEFAEHFLKRPSLSPTSTNSSSPCPKSSLNTVNKTTDMKEGTSCRHTFHEHSHHPRGNLSSSNHSRRLSLELVNNNRNHPQKSLEDSNNYLPRRSSMFLFPDKVCSSDDAHIYPPVSSPANLATERVLCPSTHHHFLFINEKGRTSPELLEHDHNHHSGSSSVRYSNVSHNSSSLVEPIKIHQHEYYQQANQQTSHSYRHLSSINTEQIQHRSHISEAYLGRQEHENTGFNTNRVALPSLPPPSSLLSTPIQQRKRPFDAFSDMSCNSSSFPKDSSNQSFKRRSDDNYNTQRMSGNSGQHRYNNYNGDKSKNNTHTSMLYYH